MKFNCDGGQESLKLLAQILYEDDPQLNVEELSAAELKALEKERETEQLDSGVNRTFIVALLPGASETFETIRLLFNSQHFQELIEQCKKCPGDKPAEITLPLDGKMQNMVLGIGTHASRYPSPYNLFSQSKQHSRPVTIRTAVGVAADNRSRIAASGKPIDFNSVETDPIELLLLLNKDLCDVLPIPPLHNCVLIVNTFVAYLVKLIPLVVIAWITKLRIKPNPRRGNSGLSGFAGNECRKIAKSTSALRKLLPSLEDVNAQSPHSSGKDEIDYQSAEYLFTTAWTLVYCIEDLDCLIHRTTNLKLHENWLEPIEKLRQHWKSFSEAYQNIHHGSANRDMTTPKIHNLLTVLPEYIMRHQHSLFRVHEQAFESVHADYKKKFEPRYSVPKTGFVSSKKKQESKKREDQEDHPSSGTRSGAQKKRKVEKQKDEATSQKRNALINFLLSLAEEPVVESAELEQPKSSSPPAPALYGNTQKARTQRLLAIAGYTAAHFPSSSEERLMRAANQDPTQIAPWNEDLN